MTEESQQAMTQSAGAVASALPGISRCREVGREVVPAVGDEDVE
jgi:hypothetical protein